MLELMNRNENKTMTSLEVAEITGKRHDQVLRDIRDEFNKLGKEIGQHIFVASYYVNSQSKQQPMFELNLDGIMQLGARYSAEIRYKLIQIAKDFNLSGIKLNKILCENKIQYKQGKQYNLYQKYIDMDLAKSYTYLDTNGSSHMCLKWTEKGRKFIYELLKELGYIYEE